MHRPENTSSNINPTNGDKEITPSGESNTINVQHGSGILAENDKKEEISIDAKVDQFGLNHEKSLNYEKRNDSHDSDNDLNLPLLVKHTGELKKTLNKSRSITFGTVVTGLLGFLIALSNMSKLDKKSSAIEMFNTGIKCYNEQNFQCAKDNFEQALKTDDFPYALYCLALMYYSGTPATPQDFLKAKEYGEKGAAKGDIQCIDLLGVIYYNGLPAVPQDFAKAKEYFEESMKKGSRKGIVNLAVMYESGTSATPKNEMKAMKYLEKADSLGDADAAYNLGVIYSSKPSANYKDYTKAKQFYEKAARQGHKSAIFNLGVMYRDGTGATPQNYFKAKEYFELATTKGDSFYATNNIGIMGALDNLGAMYKTGTPATPKDLSKAKDYYEKACNLGFSQACDNLKELQAQGSPKGK